MPDEKKLLKLIENVDKDDFKKLDEIDARFWCLLNRVDFRFTDKKHMHWTWTDTHGGDCFHFPIQAKVFNGLEMYTRSRDALKAVRPEGYIHGGDDGDDPEHYKFEFVTPYPCKAFVVKGLPTEELAELHIIIQVIAWERENVQRN